MQIGPFYAYFQPDPNIVVVRGLEQHIVVTSRHGQVHDFMIQDAIEIAQKCVEYEKAIPRAFVRLRHYWGDNGHGNGQATVQILHASNVAIDPTHITFPETSKNGQTITVDLSAQVADILSDRFEPNGSTYYDRDPD